MTTQSAGEVLAALARFQSVAITAHQRPDGDALGSALALGRLLALQGKQVQVLGGEPIPPRLRFLPDENEVTEPGPGWVEGVDALFSLDCGAFDRLGEFAVEAAGHIPVINIDHHDSNTCFGDINWVDAEASSVGEMVYRLAMAGQWRVSLEAAEAIWVAIVTDTGRFAYDNTRPQTLRIAADLVELGVNPATLDRQLYQSVSLKEMKLTQRAMESLTVYEEGRVAMVSLSRDDFAALGCGPHHAQDVVNLARNVRGVQIGIFLYELPGQEATKVSVRSEPPFDASAFCKRFNGGGHHRAAGCALTVPLESARDAVLDMIHAMWFAGDGTDEGSAGR